MTGGSIDALPRLLRGVAAGRAIALAEHAAIHGPLSSAMDAGRLIDELERAGLRGRGGAGFPIARKMRAVRESGRRAVVVANAAEGEPASAKDRVLLETAPHLVLDGAVLAAGCVDAREILVCLPEDAPVARRALDAALRERERLPVRVRLAPVPGRFLAGEETALVNHLNGGPVKPTLVPPRPAQRGVGRRPTLVNNVETLAHLALIARHGAAWFRSVGTADDPGSRLVTLAGAVARPGVYEVAPDTRLQDVLAAAGGPTEAVAAVLCGGFFGSWLAAEAVPAVTLEAASLGRVGAALGAGVLVVLPQGTCGVLETARIAAYLAEESAGQCGPCVYGLAAIAGALDRLARGGGDGHDAARLARWCAQVRGRGACHHPDGAVRLVSSALAVFADEIAHHGAGRCSGTSGRPVVAVPAAPREGAWAA